MFISIQLSGMSGSLRVKKGGLEPPCKLWLSIYKRKTMLGVLNVALVNRTFGLVWITFYLHSDIKI